MRLSSSLDYTGSVRIKPWPIIILALAHILAPIANIFYSSWLLNAGLRYYLIVTFLHGDKFGPILYLLGYPIAGIAIYKTNRWSYPIFFFIMTAMMVSNFMTWRQFPQFFNFASLLFTYVINFAVVSYFLIPQVRSVYFNPRLRWWETKPRYDVEIPTQIIVGEAASTGTIQNISEGGMFLESPMLLLLGNEIQLGFVSQGNEIKIPGKIVHVREADPRGYGVQFIHTPESASLLKENVKLIKKSGAHERIGNVSLWQEFKSWFVTVLSSGKGLVPQVPRRK